MRKFLMVFAAILVTALFVGCGTTKHVSNVAWTDLYGVQTVSLASAQCGFIDKLAKDRGLSEDDLVIVASGDYDKLAKLETQTLLSQYLDLNTEIVETSLFEDGETKSFKSESATKSQTNANRLMNAKREELNGKVYILSFWKQQ